MAKNWTVDDLVIAVRSLLDEENSAHIDDDRDILPSLNRAQESAAGIVADKYESPLLATTIVDLVTNQDSYDMPVNIFEDRVEKVELLEADGRAVPIQRISFRDSTTFSGETPNQYPVAYYIMEKSIVITPTPTAGNRLRIWYIKAPPRLTKSQGRITSIKDASTVTENYVMVDAVGSGISEDTDSLESFVNIINGNTGKIKGTFQIQFTDDQQVKFKAALGVDRSTVFGLTVLTDLADASVALDDYLCLAEGSCMLYLLQPIHNYIVQYAVSELKGEKLDESNQALQIALDKAEKRMERLWVGRESDMIVKRKNRSWSNFRR